MQARIKTQTVALITAIVFVMIGIPMLSVAQLAQISGVDLQTHKFQPRIAPGKIIPTAAAGVSGASTSGIGAGAMQQINALVADKQSRSPAQKKVSSAVLYTARMLQGKPAAPGVDYLDTGVDVDDDSNLMVDIHAEVSEVLLGQLKGVGATVITQSAKYHSIRALVPSSQVETVASFYGVVFVGPKRESATNRVQEKNGSWHGSSFAVGYNERVARIRNYVSTALTNSGVTGTPAPTGQGSVTSEGDLAHRAFDARQVFGVNGAGLKIGVISNGVASLALSQATGDLPADVKVLTGQTGTGDEGTAMLEIVHDLAPGAKLYFATADPTPEQFAQNIRELRTAGCDIIVDDVFYLNETPLHDGQLDSTISPSGAGIILQAVNDVTDDGAMYFSSAGNEGNLDSATAGSYEGTFTDSGTSAHTSKGNCTLHNFGTPATPVLYDTISGSGGAYPVLFWADPLGTPKDDYDLYMLNSAGSVVSASTNTQDGFGGQDPIESIDDDYDVVGNRLVVVKCTGNDVYFHLNTFRGQLAFSTSGETHGHSHAKNAYSVAATPVYAPYSATTLVGPWPNYFTAINQIETFSSDGLRRVFFRPDGTPYTPSDFSSTGGIVRQKPDITAADGVSVTGVGGFGSPFYGTSASAPHAAAIAALVKSAKPTITTDGMRTTLINTAVDIMGAGTDRDSGAGIVMAFEAINSLGVSGTANPELGTITASDNPGNGNGYIEAGEGGIVNIQLKNTGGVVDATGITAILSSSTTSVTITQPGISAYQNLAAGSGVRMNLTPFTFTLASDYPCGQPIDFTLTVNYNSGPRALNFSIPSGPIINIDTTLDTNPPTVVAGIATSTGAQTGRISRNSVASTCATPKKAWPGYGDTTGSRQYDSYTFIATQNACTTVTMTSPNGVNLYTAAYSPTLVPQDIPTNYYADPGSSGSLKSFGMVTVAGQTYTVLVHDVLATGGTGSGSAYNLQISGCAFAQLSANHAPVAVANDVTVKTTTGTAIASIDNGSSDPDGDAITITQAPAGPYSIGTTTVLLTVVDSKGATAQATGNVTVIDVTPDPTVTISRSGILANGQAGTYILTVSNIGDGPTTSAISVVDTLPAGLKAIAIGGSGWTCTLATTSCTRSDALAVAGSYPAITLAVSVTGNAGSSLTNTVVVSGGGERNTANDSATDATAVLAATITAIPAQPSVTVQAGKSVTISVALSGNVNLGTPATLSCSTPASLMTCTVTPSNLNIGITATPVAVTISTTGASGLLAANHEQWKYSAFFMAFLAAPMIVFAAPLVSRKRDRKDRVILSLIGLLFLLAVLAGCGGHSHTPSTPAGNHAVQVTATSGAVNTTTTINVTVTN